MLVTAAFRRKLVDIRRTCGVNAVAIIPAICTAGAVQATLDEKGAATNYRTVDPSPVLKLG